MGTVREQTAAKRKRETTSTEVRLPIRLLFTLRVIWGAFALFSLGLFLINLPQVSPGDRM